MKHKQKEMLSYAIALILLLGSLALWGTLAGAQAYNPLASSLFLWDEAVSFLTGFRSDEILDELPVARVFVEESDPPDRADHSSASDQNPVEIIHHAAAVLPPRIPKDLVGEAKPVEPPSPVPTDEETDLSQWDIHHAYTLSIPSLHLHAPILLPAMTHWSARAWELLEEQMQVGLSYGAVAYPHSVRPGAAGTLFVAGHSSPPDDRARASAFGSLFAHLPELQKGDVIFVRLAGVPVTYEVTGSRIVPSSYTNLLKQQSDESLLELITCYPVGSTKDRMVITAKLVEG